MKDLHDFGCRVLCPVMRSSCRCPYNDKKKCETRQSFSILYGTTIQEQLAEILSENQLVNTLRHKGYKGEIRQIQTIAI